VRDPAVFDHLVQLARSQLSAAVTVPYPR
jgi:hypothetical protein